ncbi:hypothetical protein CerSpe_075970 [Prunus speciosa]
MEVFSFEKRLSITTTIRRYFSGRRRRLFFSVCLIRAFELADNMVATSLDFKEFLILKYSKAMSNVKELQ